MSNVSSSLLGYTYVFSYFLEVLGSEIGGKVAVVSIINTVFNIVV